MFNTSYKTQKNLIVLLFLFFPMALLLTFSYYPAIKLLQMSFAKWDGIDPHYSYVGFQNYIDVIKDPQFLMTLQNNAAYVVISIVQIGIGLYLAIILNSRVRGKSFFKSAIFMPYILNGVAIAFMFSFLYNFESSPVNAVLKNMGLENYMVKWLGTGYFSNFSLAFVGLWRYTGFSMVIFLGALQSIPHELYEAAEIDGANFLHKIRFITFPAIKLVVELNLFLSINGAMQAFFEPFIITRGGPAGRTTTFVSNTISTAFEYNNFGKASAMGILLLMIIVAIIGMQKMLLREEGEA